MNLGNPFFPIFRIWNILQTWLLARVFVYLSFFISQILVLLYWMVCIFIFHCVTVQAENTNAKCNNIDAKCNKIFNAKCNNLSTQIVITFLTHNVITQNVIISEITTSMLFQNRYCGSVISSWSRSSCKLLLLLLLLLLLSILILIIVIIFIFFFFFFLLLVLLMK